jgi:hypothetical protein
MGLTRTEHRNDARELLASIQTVAVAADLKRLLYDQLENTDESPIIRRFENMAWFGDKYLFRDFDTEIVIKIVMFWTYLAIIDLSQVEDSRQVSTNAYLSILKASWLMQNMRDCQHLSLEFDETKAVVALVSTVCK